MRNLHFVVGFVGQVAVLFYRTAQLEKQLNKQDEWML